MTNTAISYMVVFKVKRFTGFNNRFFHITWSSFRNFPFHVLWLPVHQQVSRFTRYHYSAVFFIFVDFRFLILIQLSVLQKLTKLQHHHHHVSLHQAHHVAEELHAPVQGMPGKGIHHHENVLLQARRWYWSEYSYDKEDGEDLQVHSLFIISLFVSAVLNWSR